MTCLKPVKVNGNYYNCGCCRSCRVNYTTMWTNRLTCELSNWFEQGASFVTLTYDSLHLPADNGLHSEDLTNFFKRLRKNIINDYQDKTRRIKYYACGEYGVERKRPHYHAIIFGLNSFSEKDREILKQSWSLCEPFLFDKKPTHDSGFEHVTRESIQYVTGYVQKKLNGVLAVEEYGNRQRPFTRCSQGLGLDWCLKNEQLIKDNMFMWYKNHRVGIPRYFREKLGISQIENISNSFDLEKLEKSNKNLFEKFKQDMINKKTWYPDNLTMMSIRFERWYDNFQYSYAQQIADDFMQYQLLRGKVL